MIVVRSKKAVDDKRGKILPGDKGNTTSIIPHSNGKVPVWFEKHRGGKHYPVFMNYEDVEFVN